MFRPIIGFYSYQASLMPLLRISHCNFLLMRPMQLAMLKSPFKAEGLNLYSLFQKISHVSRLNLCSWHWPRFAVPVCTFCTITHVIDLLLWVHCGLLVPGRLLALAGPLQP